MAFSPEAEKVLREIFSVGADRAVGIGRRLRAPTPGADELFEFCQLLAEEPPEEDLQLFLQKNVGFVTGLLGGPDNADLAVIFKPKIGTRFVADFCVLQAHQGGAVAHLIEIETCHENLFTREGKPAKRLASALKQVEDWHLEISRAPMHFSAEFIRTAKKLPEYSEQDSTSRGVRFTAPDQIQNIWESFGGRDTPLFSYTAILGRWSKLDDDGKARIISRNRDGGPKVHTFEQLARNANFRLERDDWHNDLDAWEGQFSSAIE